MKRKSHLYVFCYNYRIVSSDNLLDKVIVYYYPGARGGLYHTQRLFLRAKRGTLLAPDEYDICHHFNLKTRYGLILSNKKQLSTPRVGNIFGNDDDSENEEGTDWVRKALKAEGEKNKTKRQVQKNMQRALKDDPTIFQYDEIYDEMERVKEEEKIVKKVERKPKYINNLMKSAELRKKEQELRQDRIMQQEIEAEDAMFPDKERYVTSSYKAKLEEMKEFEKEQANKDRLEAIGDVTKQGDISGFYRHLYRQTVEKNQADLGIVPDSKESKHKKMEMKKELHTGINRDDPISSDSESRASSKLKSENKTNVRKTSNLSKSKTNRQYRKRSQEKSDSESEPEPEQKKKKSIEFDVTKKGDNESKLKSGLPVTIQQLSNEIQTDESEEISKAHEYETEIQENAIPGKNNVNYSKNNTKDDKKEDKPKVQRKESIWKKRTVGPVFEAALARYLLRKQQRLAAC